jgi:hypothetical protein
MNPTQANSWECLQRAIDAEIKLLEESVRTLKLRQVRRNALSPVSSLPPEALVIILPCVLTWKGRPPCSTAPCISSLSSMAHDCTESTPLMESPRLQHPQFSKSDRDARSGPFGTLILGGDVSWPSLGRCSVWYIPKSTPVTHFPRICHL